MTSLTLSRGWFYQTFFSQMLVSHGAEINARSNDGITPLRDALHLSQEVVDFLLENGADPDIADNNGKSARDFAPGRFDKSSDAAVVVSVPDTEDIGQDASDVVVPEPAVAPGPELAPSDAMEMDQPIEPIAPTECPLVEVTMAPTETEVEIFYPDLCLFKQISDLAAGC